MYLGAFDDSRFKSKPKPLTLTNVEVRTHSRRLVLERVNAASQLFSFVFAAPLASSPAQQILQMGAAGPDAIANAKAMAAGVVLARHAFPHLYGSPR